MSRGRRGNWLSPYRRGRSSLYKAARVMGNIQPWLELDARKIVRRQLNRSLGRHLGRGAFGGGAWGELLAGAAGVLLKQVLGLNKR